MFWMIRCVMNAMDSTAVAAMLHTSVVISTASDITVNSAGVQSTQLLVPRIIVASLRKMVIAHEPLTFSPHSPVSECCPRHHSLLLLLVAGTNPPHPPPTPSSPVYLSTHDYI